MSGVHGDAQALLDRRGAKREQMALEGAGGVDEHEVLFRADPD